MGRPVHTTILTLHPEGKQGVNIDKRKYDTLRKAIEASLRAHGEMTFNALAADVESRLNDFDGSPMWYFTTVKLDLEARGNLERVPDSRPQRIRLTKRS
jgi:hypothetical protein